MSDISKLITMELPTATDIVKAIREAEYRGYMKAVEDRPQGKWKNHKDEHYCSNCKEVVIGDWYDEGDWYDFCPWCGAKMKGADDE